MWFSVDRRNLDLRQKTEQGKMGKGVWNSSTALFNHEGVIDSTEDLPDLVEEDVWSAMRMSDIVVTEVRDEWYTSAHQSGHQTQRWRAGNHVGGLSLALEIEKDRESSHPRLIQQFRSTESNRQHQQRPAAASAPVSIPAWPTILRDDPSSESLREPAAELDDGEWMPPHEYLARENISGDNMVATSVFEGVGRKLKGRDLDRVRNTVWRQTGFFG